MQKRRIKTDIYNSHSGFTLVELIVAGILLAAVMSLSVQMLAAAAKQQRNADRRQTAAAEAANLMERITARSYETITHEQLQTWTFQSATISQLPDAELSLFVDAEAGPPAGKRILLEIRWRDTAGVSTAPLRLTGWVYESHRGTP